MNQGDLVTLNVQDADQVQHRREYRVVRAWGDYVELQQVDDDSVTIACSGWDFLPENASEGEA